MLTFIAQYWLEVVFGLVATGAGFLAKKFYSLYKKEQTHLKETEEKELKDSINQDIIKTIEDHKEQSYNRHLELQKEVNSLKDELNVLREGILCIQGKSFKADCKKLLDTNYEISPEDWDIISEEHSVYKSLGGNHDGDRLYEDVTIKYHNNLE